MIEIAIKAALDAGTEILKVYETDDFDVDFKSDNSPLTRADIASHREIIKILEKTEIPVLSEEGRDIPYAERKDWEKLWIVDPLDGTKEFIRRNGEFTVNIALVKQGRPMMGVIYVPVTDVLYFASEDIGAYKCKHASEADSLGEWLSSGQKLPLDSDRDTFTIVASRSHPSPETEAFIEFLRDTHEDIDTISRGSSLKLCMVAEGRADCYPRFAPTMEWDTAAGQAICTLAGCGLIDYETREVMRYNRENLVNNWFLVTSEHFSETVLI